MSSLLLGAFKQSGMPFSQVLVLGGRLPYMAPKVSWTLRAQVPSFPWHDKF